MLQAHMPVLAEEVLQRRGFAAVIFSHLGRDHVAVMDIGRGRQDHDVTIVHQRINHRIAGNAERKGGILPAQQAASQLDGFIRKDIVGLGGRLAGLAGADQADHRHPHGLEPKRASVGPAEQRDGP